MKKRETVKGRIEKAVDSVIKLYGRGSLLRAELFREFLRFRRAELRPFKAMIANLRTQVSRLTGRVHFLDVEKQILEDMLILTLMERGLGGHSVSQYQGVIAQLRRSVNNRETLEIVQLECPREKFRTAFTHFGSAEKWSKKGENHER